MRAVLHAILVGTLALPCFAQKFSDSDWKTGMLIDVRFEKDSRIVGTAGPQGGLLVQKGQDSTYYEIEAGDMVYVAKRTLTRRGDKQLKMTVNAPVKFAIKGDDFYLLDEDGKQHKLSIEKKTLKAKPQTSKDQEE